MPIFQVDLEHSHPDPFEPDSIGPELSSTARSRRLSEESLRIDLCEGPIPDSPRPSSPSKSEHHDDHAPASDRAELIQRLKRGQSPTWIPSHHVRNRSPSSDITISQSLHRPPQIQSVLHEEQSVKNSPPSSPPKSPSETQLLLPPAQITPERTDPLSIVDERLRQGLNIERPRSALHSGDFTRDAEAAAAGERPGEKHSRRRATGHVTAESGWAATSPPRHFTPFRFDGPSARANGTGSFRDITSPSSSPSLSSSFVYQLPTSPLVQSESNEELDLSMPLDHVDFPPTQIGSRRHTLTSTAFSPFASPSPRASLSGRTLLHRREGSLPYQAHQPRRSLTNTPILFPPGASPQTPAYLRSRRQSVSSDSSPIQHASMVGSYEESILRGRMSTTPSKPLEFLAQIGVLGRAVYYSYGSGGHGRLQSDDGPSPYVGQIDLENGLPNIDEGSRTRRKAQSRYADRHQADQDLQGLYAGHQQNSEHVPASRPKRQAGSPRAPPGGSYRIPEKGQVQIVIKNPNKTAVKLFLVPYDLAGMEPGTKTFIRQRSYSTGPIIDNAPAMTESDSKDRPMLRYLVHLHICCPSKGRYYLYKSIRIVFANRVPDGKEKLRNETTWPEPRFSPYKPIRVMHPPLSSSSGPGAMLAAEKAWRRRSLCVATGSSSQAFDLTDGIFASRTATTEHGSSDSARGNALFLDPVPLRLPRDRINSEASDATDATSTGLLSPGTPQASKELGTESGLGIWNLTRYEKLSKGEFGYGGNAYGPSGGGSPGNGSEGLLSQRLRSLGVKTPALDPQDD